MRILLTFVLIFAASASAEIEKIAIPGENGMNLYWWPKVASADGWRHDRRASLMYSVNAQAPDGQSFSDATAVMYARALYKPRVPEFADLSQLIEHDKNEFLARYPDLKVEQAPSLRTGSTEKLATYTFNPGDEGNWEVVAYGEEAEFYLIFTLSARSEDATQGALEAFRQFVANYNTKEP